MAERGRWTPAMSPDPPVGPTRTRRRRPGLLGLFGVLVAACILASFGWRLAGGSIYAIPTASMCPDLCVGTLAVDWPVTGTVHRGEVVTFHPPDTGTLYTHRVVAVLPGGSFKTAGDARHTVDPWTVAPADVRGHVVLSVRALGWLWPALPWLAAGLALILVLRRPMTEATRRDWDRLFLTALLVVPILVLRPLVRDAVVSYETSGDQQVHVVLANAGLLPTRFTAGDAAPVDIPSGHLFSAQARATPAAPLVVRQVAALSWWEWVVLVLVVLSPMLGYAARALWRRAGAHPRGSLAPAGTG